MAEHGGSGRRYEVGCRCDECRRANRDRHARRTSERAALLAAGEVTPVHGTRATYDNYGCRCGPCRAAMAEANRRWRVKALAAEIRAGDRHATLQGIEAALADGPAPESPTTGEHVPECNDWCVGDNHYIPAAGVFGPLDAAYDGFLEAIEALTAPNNPTEDDE